MSFLLSIIADVTGIGAAAIGVFYWWKSRGKNIEKQKEDGDEQSK